MPQWRCTVCGYLHEGKEPPQTCPRCGALKWRFILNQALEPELDRSLRAAFAGEAKAAARNRAFAERARREGYPQVARLFQAVALAEEVHAAEFLKYLEGVVGSTEENLAAAFEHELAAKDEHYPELMREAYAARREDLVWSLTRSRDVEERHAALYKSMLGALAGEREIAYHVCKVCGYVFEGEPPERCPVCRSTSEEFVAVE